jgi:hypothetical protein
MVEFLSHAGVLRSLPGKNNGKAIHRKLPDSGGLFERDDFSAFIITAMRTNLMRRFELVALRAHRQGNGLEKIVRPSHISS